MTFVPTGARAPDPAPAPPRQPEHLAPFAAQKAFINVLEIVAQVLPLVTFARRLPPHWDRLGPLSQQDSRLILGLGRPEFYRVPSALNVSDAVSVTTAGHELRAGRGCVHPVDEVMQVLGEAATDVECLRDCLILSFGRSRRLLGVGAPGGHRSAHPGTGTEFSGGVHDQKGATAPE